MSAKTVPELSPPDTSSGFQPPSPQSGEGQGVAAACPFCGQPGVYIRTRNFSRGQIAQVWTCTRRGCDHFHLYWHTDMLRSLPPVHPQCRVFGWGQVVMAYLKHQTRIEVAK